MPRYSWTQPCCDRCWDERNPGRQATKLVEAERDDEICVYCGLGTVSGIYVRIDPNAAPYPTRTKDED